MGRSRAVGAGGSGIPGGEDDPFTFGPRSKRRRMPASGEHHESSGQEGKKALYHCNYCQKDITHVVRIKCAKCPDYDLCVECFSVGAETYPHKGNHPYRVMDSLSFPLIHPDWHADEEILLLEAVEMYGLSNWTEVADHVGTRSKEQCHEHYYTMYMESPCTPLPDMSRAAGKTKAELSAMGKEAAEGKRSQASEGGGGVKVEVSPPASVKLEDVKEEDTTTGWGAGTSSEGRREETSVASEGTDREKVGRKILSPSGDSHAQAGAKKSAAPHPPGGGGTDEKDGADKDKNKTGAEGDAAFQSNRSIGSVKKPKVSMDDAKAGTSAADLTGYNLKRNEFDPEYDNEAEIPLAEMEFKDSDTDVDRALKIKMLHIYFARLEERKRRKEFILERGLLAVKKQQARNKEERELFQRARVFARYHTPEEHEALLTGLNAERKIRQRINELQEYRMAGCHTLAEGEAYESERKRRETEASLKKARETTSYLYPNKAAANNRSNRYSNREKGEGELVGARELGKAKVLPGIPPISMAVMSTVGSKGAKKAGAMLDLSGHAGTELLSTSERDLCSQLRLLPVHYLRVKEVLMSESDKRGGVDVYEAYQMFKVDPLKTHSVYYLLLSKGWISSPPLPRAHAPRISAGSGGGKATGDLEALQQPELGHNKSANGKASKGAQRIASPPKDIAAPMDVDQVMLYPGTEV